MTPTFQNIKVIINPAAGEDEPILNTLETTFRDQDLQWSVDITQSRGDGQRLARAAVEAGYDLVAAYGGDGTLMDVANGMIGSDVPLALLPGGTGNVLVAKLGIPGNLADAAQLIVNPGQVKTLDAGLIEDQDWHFLLRVDFGITVDMLQKASRESKDQYGFLAYVVSALENWRSRQTVQYHLTIDDQEIETDGLFCIIVNVGSIVGALDLSFAPTADAQDGLLDVFVIKHNVASLESIAALVFNQQIFSEVIQHWRGERITVVADPAQGSGIDGDDLGSTPLTCRAVPQAIKVLVP
jgi:diacylglycerol kinase (ATP)